VGIKFEARKQQIIDFDNLVYGKNISFTDIDGIMELKNKGRFFFEIKYGDAEVLLGQRLTLQRLVDDAGTAGKEAIAVIANHYIHDTNKRVLASDCIVKEYYHSTKRTWVVTEKDTKVKVYVDKFVEKINGECLKNE
jgi:hypothetical protein